ncbi:MAG: chemotaxis protein CheW [Pseudomonadota bacterium]
MQADLASQMPAEASHHRSGGGGTGPGDKDESLTVLAFVLAGQDFAVPVSAVREILEYRDPIPLPAESGGAIGMIDLRGKTIPIVDLATRLGLAGSPVAESAPGSIRPAEAATGKQDAPNPSRDAEKRIIVLDIVSATGPGGEDGAGGSDELRHIGIPCEEVSDVWRVPASTVEAVPRLRAVVPHRADTAVEASANPRPRDAAQGAAVTGVLRHEGRLALLIDHHAALGASVAGPHG